MNDKPLRCPLCNRKLVQKKCGYVCKNSMCVFYWKLCGWCLKDSDSSLWQYTDNCVDKHIAWDRAHPNVFYPPLKEKINERHIDAMHTALRKDENLCFVIPLRYCSPDSEVVLE